MAARRQLGEIEELMKVQAPLAAVVAAERFSAVRAWLDAADRLLESYLRDESNRIDEMGTEDDLFAEMERTSHPQDWDGTGASV